jgi:hypothetical protein
MSVEDKIAHLKVRANLDIMSQIAVEVHLDKTPSEIKELVSKSKRSLYYYKKRYPEYFI